VPRDESSVDFRSRNRRLIKSSLEARREDARALVSVKAAAILTDLRRLSHSDPLSSFEGVLGLVDALVRIAAGMMARGNELDGDPRAVDFRRG
jgi:hypothetical protein